MISIFLAAYQGEKYLAAQIDSILSQSCGGWRLVISDDCSTDATASIAGEYAARYPDKITFCRRETPSGSAKNHFAGRGAPAGGDYIMTCDQDDVWLPDKIEVTLKRMKELEARFGPSTPLLVHTDLRVVDGELRLRSPSMAKLQKLDLSRDSLSQLLAQNIVTGCTMMANRALVRLACPIPPQALMHDWWLALAAAAFGQIGLIGQATLLYRQHGSNEVGAKDAGSLPYLFRRLFHAREVTDSLSGTYRQAAAFRDRYAALLPRDALETVEMYASIPALPAPRRLAPLLRHDYWKTGAARRAGQLLFTFLCGDGRS